MTSRPTVGAGSGQITKTGQTASTKFNANPDAKVRGDSPVRDLEIKPAVKDH